MDASCVQRHQEIMASQSLDSMLVCTKPESQEQQQQQEKKARPPSEEALKCPRCDSSNTKFCYYNNYSLTQPRYFCKSCRRYWTKGGTLRNVPVGGGCRKNKRCSSSSRRSTPDHLQSFITSPTSSSQQLISPLPAYDHYNNDNNNINNHPFAHHGNIPLLLGNAGNTHFDLFGNQFNGNLFDSLRNGVVYHESNNPQSNGVSLYYGGGVGGNLEDGDHGRANNVNLNHDDHQMGMQFDLLQLQTHQEIMSNASSRSSTPTIKQELGGDNRALFSYIMTGGGGELDTPRESWNAGVLGSSWHNLLNSPLM